MTSVVSPAKRERMRGILEQLNDGADASQAEPVTVISVRASALSESLLGSKIAGAFHPDSWTGRARFAPPIEPTNTATEHPQPPKLAGTGE